MTKKQNGEIPPRAVIHITIRNTDTIISYKRRMYSILRRYTPEVIISGDNECIAEITGLRTFFKMSYEEMMRRIEKDLYNEIGVRCVVSSIPPLYFDSLEKENKENKENEINDKKNKKNTKEKNIIDATKSKKTPNISKNEKQKSVVSVKKAIQSKHFSEVLETREVYNKKSVSTYPEINTLFRGASYVPVENRKRVIVKRKVKLTVPFLGKVK